MFGVQKQSGTVDVFIQAGLVDMVFTERLTTRPQGQLVLYGFCDYTEFMHKYKYLIILY